MRNPGIGNPRDGESRDEESRDGESRGGESRGGESMDEESRDGESLGWGIQRWGIQGWGIQGCFSPLATAGHTTAIPFHDIRHDNHVPPGRAEVSPQLLKPGRDVSRASKLRNDSTIVFTCTAFAHLRHAGLPSRLMTDSFCPGHFIPCFSCNVTA